MRIHDGILPATLGGGPMAGARRGSTRHMLCDRGCMNPATDVDAKQAVERYARLSPAEQDAIMARGRRIVTLGDLEGLSEADAERLRPVVEAHTADS